MEIEVATKFTFTPINSMPLSGITFTISRDDGANVKILDTLDDTRISVDVGAAGSPRYLHVYVWEDRYGLGPDWENLGLVWLQDDGSLRLPEHDPRPVNIGRVTWVSVIEAANAALALPIKR